MWRWCTALLALAAGAGAANSWLNQFGNESLSRLSDTLDAAPVQYYEPVVNVTYVSSDEFDMRAMGHLYNSTKYIMDFIVPKQAYPEGIVSVSDGHVEVVELRPKWRSLLTYYAGPVSLLTVALVLVLVLPLAALLWLCCYCCRSSRRRRPFDRKYDSCLKGVYVIILIALLTLLLFGVVCLFATEQQLEHGTATLHSAVDDGARDTREFLNATQAHARWLLVVNYRQLRAHLGDMLKASGEHVSERLAEFSRAAAVSSLRRVVQGLPRAQASLAAVGNLTRSLRTNAGQLNDGLRKVRKMLLDALAACEQPQCRRLQDKYQIGQLDTQIQYNQLPDVSELEREVEVLVSSSLKEEVEEGERVFANIKREVTLSVQKHVPAASDALDRMGRRLEELADRVTWAAGNVSQRVQQGAGAAADGSAQMQLPWAVRRAAGLGAAGLVLSALAALVLGVLCGVCGKRPNAYSNDCCHKGAGARCLHIGSLLLFMAGAVAALMLAVYFFVGAASQRLVCDPLTVPQNNIAFGDIEEFVQLEYTLFHERKDPDFNITSVLRRCHLNQTIYKTLDLHRIYDVNDLQTELEAQLEAQLQTLQPSYPPTARRVQILNPRAKVELRRLAESGLAEFNFDRILQALETNLTSLSLDALAATLATTSAELSARPGYGRVSGELGDAAALLRRYALAYEQPLRRDTAELAARAVDLRDSLRFNRSSLRAAVDELTHEVAVAEDYLATSGPQLLRNATQQVSAGLAAPLSAYLRRLSFAVDHDLGRCGPLSTAFNSTRDAVCRRILVPLNGYWVSCAWTLLLLAPLLAVAPRLARLYLHVDPYPGPLEAEYLYDAYADRDNVPLANAFKAEGKRARRRSPARADQPHHTRYNDMAPKHWEEGPPRYPAGPTEYERPPPYYYPGPAERP